MNRESLSKLRHDRRLLGRRGWITAEEREKAISTLDDAAAKATTLGEAADERSPGEDADSDGSKPAQ